MPRSPESEQSEQSGQPEAEAEGVANYDVPTGNWLLGALPAEEYGHLLPYLEAMELSHGYVFYQPDEPISHVYFPISGVASMLMLGQGDEVVEVGTVGNEGMVGIPVFLGRDTTPGRALMQVPGAGLRMLADDFRREVVDVPGSRLQLLLQRYTHALMIQMAQSVVCNRLHTVERRAARWLLTTADRAESSTFPLTQEFLAQMLGVRRASVSEVASTLQGEGLIRYTRGIVSIADRAGMEERACVCYRIIRDEFDRMLADL